MPLAPLLAVLVEPLDCRAHVAETCNAFADRCQFGDGTLPRLPGCRCLAERRVSVDEVIGGIGELQFELEQALASPNGGLEVVEVRVRRDNRRDLDTRIRALRP